MKRFRSPVLRVCLQIPQVLRLPVDTQIPKSPFRGAHKRPKSFVKQKSQNTHGRSYRDKVWSWDKRMDHLETAISWDPILSQKSPIPSPPLPYPPTPTFWPWHSPVLGHIKFASPMGLFFQWWPTRPSFDTYAARDKRSGVHIVVPPIGLQFPLAPWVISLAPPLGALWSIQ